MGRTSGQKGRLTSWDNGGLVNRVCSISQQSNQGMTALMVSGQLAVVLTDDCRLPLCAHHDPILGKLQGGHADSQLPLPGCFEGCHIHQIGQICSAEAGSSPGNNLQPSAQLCPLQPCISVSSIVPAPYKWAHQANQCDSVHVFYLLFIVLFVVIFTACRLQTRRVVVTEGMW